MLGHYARTISRKRVQGEALFIVVSLAATLGQHGPRRGDVPAKLFHYMALFLAMAELEQAQFCSWLTERVVIVVKVV